MKPEKYKLYNADFDELRFYETKKLNKDVQIVQRAFEKIRSCIGEKSNIHFVIGSQFYMKWLPFYRMRAFLGQMYAAFFGQLDPIEKLIWFIMHQFSRLKFANSISCSFLNAAMVTLRRVFETSSSFRKAKVETFKTLKVS